ncbi:TPA: hypothetical protein HA244_05190 [Candidatus Micrarchaeota archaeon]|nr:hypothetical protein [Candidatus Micrarchaeota archaeon]
MPIFAVSSKRANVKPIHYFKGTLQEVRELPAEKIAEAFAATGHGLEAGQAEAIKQTILSAYEHGDARFQEKFLMVPVGDSHVFLRARASAGGKLLVHQAPVIHGIIPRDENDTPPKERDAFAVLRRILETGFHPKKYGGPNVIGPNSSRLEGKFESPFAHGSHGQKTEGDTYHLELLSPFARKDTGDRDFHHVSAAEPGQIKRINIFIRKRSHAQTSVSREAALGRKEFYERELGKYGIVLRVFYEGRRLFEKKG